MFINYRYCKVHLPSVPAFPIMFPSCSHHFPSVPHHFPRFFPLNLKHFPTPFLKCPSFSNVPHISVTTLHSSARLRGRHVASPTGRRTRRRGADSAGARGLVSTVHGFSSWFCWMYGLYMDIYIYTRIYGDFPWVWDISINPGEREREIYIYYILRSIIYIYIYLTKCTHRQYVFGSLK